MDQTGSPRGEQSHPPVKTSLNCNFAWDINPPLRPTSFPFSASIFSHPWSMASGLCTNSSMLTKKAWIMCVSLAQALLYIAMSKKGFLGLRQTALTSLFEGKTPVWNRHLAEMHETAQRNVQTGGRKSAITKGKKT
jgi:hypothetical protein